MPFPRPARRTAALVAALALAVPAASTASPAEDAGTGPDPVSERASFPHRSSPLTDAQYTGVDGQTHKSAPILIRGRNGTVFYGEEMDGACGYGKQFDTSLKKLAKLAKLIQRSGRRVVFTVPPNKSAVVKKDILKSQLPHGKCDLMGIAQQDRTLDRFADKNYVGLRKPLAARAAKGQKNLYWPIDTHWTRLAAQTWVDGLAQKLDPALAARQTFRRGRETIETDVSFLGVIPETKETGPAVFSTTNVKVKAEPAYDPENVIVPYHSWRTKPAGRTWPGKTLLIGDSFTYRALDSLMPLFNEGEFIWYGQPGIPNIPAAIAAADTVVIQVVQRWVPISPLIRAQFTADVRAALT